MSNLRLFFALCMLALGLLTGCDLVSDSEIADVEPATVATVALPPTDAPTIMPTVAPTSEAVDVPAPFPTATLDPAGDSTDLTTFTTNLQTAITNHDYTQMVESMYPAFYIGLYRSEWRNMSASDVISEIETLHLPTTANVQFEARTTEEITSYLDGQPPHTMLGPDVQIVSVLYSTGWGPTGADDALLFIAELDNGQYAWLAFLYKGGSFAPEMGRVAPPAGIIYRTWQDGLWLSGPAGAVAPLTNQPLAIPAPDGKHAVYFADDYTLWLINTLDGTERQLASDYTVSSYAEWVTNDTLLLGVWLSPDEAEGPNLGHIALLNITSDELTILDETRLSTNRAAFAPATGSVAFSTIPTSADDKMTTWLYTPAEGTVYLDPGRFTGDYDIANAALFNPAWSPDGTQLAWLAAIDNQVTLVVLDFSTMQVTPFINWEPARFGALVPSPNWSPDGNWVGLEVWSHDPLASGLWLTNANTAETIQIDKLAGDPLWLNESQLVYNQYDGNRNGQAAVYDLNSRQAMWLDLFPSFSPAISLVQGELPLDESQFVPAPGDPTALNRLSFEDNALGFALEYDPTWTFDFLAEPIIHTVTLEKDGYRLRMEVRPEDRQATCEGLLDNPGRYKQDLHPTLNLWRPIVELGYVNGYHDDNSSFMNVIAPAELEDEPDSNGYWGQYTCLTTIEGRMISIEYWLPASVSQLEAGEFSAEHVAEMDRVVASLRLFDPVLPVVDELMCPRPEDLIMTGVEVVLVEVGGESFLCLVWDDVTDDEIGVRVAIEYPRSQETFTYELPAGSEQFIIPFTASPRLDESREQCSRRQSVQVFIIAIRTSDFGNKVIGAMGMDVECPLPS